MKKNILLFFIFFALPLYSEKIIITSDYFSGDKGFLRFINENLDNRKKLGKKLNKYFIYKGYDFTKVENITNNNKDKMIIHIDEVRIKDFIIIGNKKISDRIIRVYLSFRKDDIFNKKRLRLQIKKLYNTGLFDSIEYNINKLNRSINIKIIEKKKKYFEINGNYTEQYGVMPFLGFINRHLFNTDIYMNLNAECGFWDRLNYYKLNADFLYRGIYLDISHRYGKRYINKNDFSSREEKINAGISLYSSKNYNIYIFIPLENYYFFNMENIKQMNIYNGLRYGMTLLLSYDNKREVLNFREESIITAQLNNMFFKKSKNYFKFTFNLKWHMGIFYDFGIVYKNSTSFIDPDAPFDQLFLIGGDNQRGYNEGSYITSQKFENNLEIENELIFSYLKLVLFIDISYFKNNGKYDLIASYGPGMVLDILSFNIQFFYGISTDKKFQEGQFYIKLKKIFY